MFSWPVFFSGVFSAIIGVAATICYNFWAERRRLRFECFRQLMRHGPGQPEFLKAFNEIPAVFAGRRRVLAAHLAMLDKSKETETFHGREELVNLIKAIAADLSLRGMPDRQLISRFGRE
jgi:hypothetical protein